MTVLVPHRYQWVLDELLLGDDVCSSVTTEDEEGSNGAVKEVSNDDAGIEEDDKSVVLPMVLVVNTKVDVVVVTPEADVGQTCDVVVE